MQLWCHCSGWRCFHSNSCWGSWVLECFLHSGSIYFFHQWASYWLSIKTSHDCSDSDQQTRRQSVERTPPPQSNSPLLYSHVDNSRLHTPDGFHPNPWRNNPKWWEMSCLTMSLYVDQHHKLMRSFLGRDPSSIQVLWKSVQQFLSNPADKPSKQQNNQPAGDIRPQLSPDWQHLNASPVDCRASSQFSPETRVRTQNLDLAVHSQLHWIRTCLWRGDGGQIHCFKSESICVSALTLIKTRSALIINQYQQSIFQLIGIILWISVWLNIGLWLAAGCHQLISLSLPQGGAITHQLQEVTRTVTSHWLFSSLLQTEQQQHGRSAVLIFLLISESHDRQLTTHFHTVLPLSHASIMLAHWLTASLEQRTTFPLQRNLMGLYWLFQELVTTWRKQDSPNEYSVPQLSFLLIIILWRGDRGSAQTQYINNQSTIRVMWQLSVLWLAGFCLCSDRQKYLVSLLDHIKSVHLHGNSSGSDHMICCQQLASHHGNYAVCKQKHNECFSPEEEHNHTPGKMRNQ